MLNPFTINVKLGRHGFGLIEGADVEIALPDLADLGAEELMAVGADLTRRATTVWVRDLASGRLELRLGCLGSRRVASCSLLAASCSVRAASC